MSEINKSEPTFVEEAGWKEFQNAVNIYFPMGKCAPGDRCIASVRVTKPKLLLLALSYWFVRPTDSIEKDSDKHAIKSSEDWKWGNKDLSFKDAHLCTSNLKWNDFYELHKQFFCAASLRQNFYRNEFCSTDKFISTFPFQNCFACYSSEFGGCTEQQLQHEL